jgi:hypothetical protein
VSSGKALFSLSVLVLFGMSSAAPRTFAQQQQTTDQTAAPAAAVTSPTTQSDDARRTTSQTNDLEITANVTARELRFEVVLDPKVEFPGQPNRDTVWEAERQNLPRPVQPGVTYRNIGIQLIITSRFADIERIVAEALGEVPLTNDTPQENPAPQTTQPPAQASPAKTPERKP